MKIRDDSERYLASLARACYVFERIMHGKWNFLLFGIDNNNGLES